ncbi:MAG: vWA domain-containing protein [Terrimicrobiaceae bacterium]
MKTLLLLLIALSPIGVAAYGESGVAIAIVYDTSGSMSDKVPTDGGQKKKYVIASEALGKIVGKIDAYAKSGNKVQAGIVCFPGPSNRADAVPFAAWNPEPFRKWLGAFNAPGGGTPLGDAVLAASRLVADSPLAKKHVVVLTDGENNQGISSDEGVRAGSEYARKKNGAAISYYFVAFDTSASQFGDLKKKGAVVLSAGNETELQKGLTNIFTQKILLEEEEK